MPGAALSSSRSTTPTVVVAMVGLWLCWGSSFPAIRVMVMTLPPLLASGTVFLTAGVTLAVIRPGALRGVSRRRLVTAAGVGLCLLGAQALVAVAEQHVLAGTAALLVATIPLWVLLLRAGFGDYPAPAGVVRLLLGFAGVVLVLVTGSDGVGWSAWGLVVVAAAVSWAGGTLWAARSVALPPPRTAIVVQLLSGGLALLVAGTVAGEPSKVDPGSVTGSSWLALGYLVLVDSLVGFALYNWLLRSAPVALVSTYAYAVPVVACLVGVVVLAEPFPPLVLLGAAAIVTAVASDIRSGTDSNQKPGSVEAS